MSRQLIFRAPKVTILKARRPWKKTRTYSRLNKLAQAKASAIRIGFTKGIEKFKSKVDPEDLYRAWLKGDYRALTEAIPFADLESDLEPFSKGVGSALSGTGRGVIESMPPAVMRELRWSMSNPAMRDYVSKKTGQLVQDITEGTRNRIAEITGTGFDRALTARQLARKIRPEIGLGTRLGKAHANYVDGLLAKGIPESRVQSLSDRYESQLLDYRALMISRTEASFARNAAQHSVWDAAADQGLIDKKSTQKEWITDGDPCNECLDVEDQGPIGLDEQWDSDDGPIDYPPLHPNCMCGMDLVFEEVEDEG